MDRKTVLKLMDGRAIKSTFSQLELTIWFNDFIFEMRDLFLMKYLCSYV